MKFIGTTELASGTYTATDNVDFKVPFEAIGARFVLDVTAASGTSPTLAVKLQRYDHVTGKYVDLPGGAFAQKTAAGTDDLVIYPGAAETANRSVSDVLVHDMRAVLTIGGTTPSFTFALAMQALG